MKRTITLIVLIAGLSLAGCGSSVNEQQVGTASGSQFVGCMANVPSPTVAIAENDWSHWVIGLVGQRGQDYSVGGCVQHRKLTAKESAAGLVIVNRYTASLTQQQQAAAARAKQTAQRHMQDVAKSELQGMILKDARQKVTEGLLNGPILKVECQTSPTVATDPNQASYSCMAVTSTSSDGTEQGYGYVGAANFQTGEITAHLGNS